MPIVLTLALASCFFINLAASRVVLSLYALELGAQPFAVGLVLAMYYTFPMLLSWPVGRLADRFGSRWLLLFAAASGAAGLTIPYFLRDLSAIYAAAALGGLALAFYNVLLQNLVGILSGPQQRTRNFSNLSLMGASANFIGPLIAGVSIDHLGHALASLWMVAPSLAAAVMIVLWGGVLPGGSRQSQPGTKILQTLANPEIRRMLATSGLVQLGMDLFQFYIPIYGHDIGLSGTAIGTVLSAFAVAAFVVRMIMPRLIALLGEEQLLSYSFFLAGAGYLLAPLSESVPVLALIAFVYGLGIGCTVPVTMMLMFSRSEQGRSGETLGLRLTTNNFVRTVGPTVFGLIASASGMFAVFWLSAMVMAAGGLLARPRKRAGDS